MKKGGLFFRAEVGDAGQSDCESSLSVGLAERTLCVLVFGFLGCMPQTKWAIMSSLAKSKHALDLAFLKLKAHGALTTGLIQRLKSWENLTPSMRPVV